MILIMASELKTLNYNCIICEGNRFTEVYDLKKISNKPYKIIKCLNCNLVSIYPIPTRNFIKEYYNNPLYPKSAYFRNMTVNFYGSPEVKLFLKGLNLIEKFYHEKGKILDVGCSSGVFLNMAKSRGWETVGIDISKDFVNYAKKNFELDVRLGYLEDFSFEENSLDVITLWDLVEHLTEPNKLLIEVYRILKPGGIILILTPDQDSLIKKITDLSYKISFGKWKTPVSVVYDIHHLYYFSIRNITKLLNKIGFKTIYLVKEETILDRIIGEKSDHWVKKNRLIVYGLKTIFFLARLTNKKNKLLILCNKHK